MCWHRDSQCNEVESRALERLTSRTTTKSARDLWRSQRHRISYSRDIYDERRAYAAGIESDRDHTEEAPRLCRMCADDAEHLLLHQDAFAADHQGVEYMLLGMAIT